MQIDMFPEATTSPKRLERRGAFTDNMKLPIHRWFRYSAGFSAEWVQDIVAKHDFGRPARVLDPFAGSGTCPLAAAMTGSHALGIDAHPFVVRIAKIKTEFDVDLEEASRIAFEVIAFAKSYRPDLSSEPELLQRCYPLESLTFLLGLREGVNGKYAEGVGTKEVDLIWLCLTSILRVCSGVGTAQWQYLLPNKSKSKVADPETAFLRFLDTMKSDIEYFRANSMGQCEISLGDARASLPDSQFDLVITSPPYPNNYDYADATRLEMTFWGEVERWSDLHQSVRKHLMRSCSQHTSADKNDLDELLSHEDIEPIRDELSTACRLLQAERQTRAGRKSYDTMAAAYFLDMARVAKSLRRVTTSSSKVYMIIGDSAPYGIHLPVEQWFDKLFQNVGFGESHFEKVRDRNTKWKNRKHRVPLHEGIFSVNG